MGAGTPDDDRPTVDLGPRALVEADAAAGAREGERAGDLGVTGGGGRRRATGAGGDRADDVDEEDADDPAGAGADDPGDPDVGDADAPSAASLPAAPGARGVTASLAAAVPADLSLAAASEAGSAVVLPARSRTVPLPFPTDALPLAPLAASPGEALSGRRRAASHSLSRATQPAASPLEAMRLDEMQRTRVFLKVVLGLCIGGVLVAVISRGDPVARAVVFVGTAGAAIGAGWLLYALRAQTTYDSRQMVVPGLFVIFGAMSGVYYWGVASPVAAMLVYGIYFFSLGANARVTAAMSGIVAAAHGALGLGIVAGVLEDRGVVSMSGLRTLDQLTLVAIVEFLYAIAFVTARASQRVTLEAMTQLQQAARTVAQRDALLAEARAELDRALKIGGPGRFTDQTIGSFKLGVLIGRGGMGEVYEARAVIDGREAAVKLLHPGTLGDPTAVQRFLREASTASRLDCPHVVRVLEVGTTAGELPYLAMERLRGTDLAHQLRRHRRLELGPARVLAEQVALGLEAARVAGIVHRDLKPHNVFLAEEAGGQRWKILDFGVSKSGGSGTLTKGHVVGTPAYMAPEQARGESVDHRADVYSLAAILYRAVTGHPAFTGRDVPTTLYDVVYRVPTQPSLHAPLPADVDRVLAIGLAKRPDDRFATALELARWFAAAVDGGLDHDQRRRADDVIARYPWGTHPGSAAS